jgi:hypothetical protein
MVPMTSPGGDRFAGRVPGPRAAPPGPCGTRPDHLAAGSRGLPGQKWLTRLSARICRASVVLPDGRGPVGTANGARERGFDPLQDDPAGDVHVARMPGNPGVRCAVFTASQRGGPALPRAGPAPGAPPHAAHAGAICEGRVRPWQRARRALAACSPGVQPDPSDAHCPVGHAPCSMHPMRRGRPWSIHGRRRRRIGWPAGGAGRDERKPVCVSRSGRRARAWSRGSSAGTA